VQEPALQQQGTDEAALYKIGGDVHAPVLLKSVAPRYPRSWFGKDAPSVVVVGLVVTETGQPNNLHIVRSGGDKFDKNAIDAVKKYRFQPATKAGQPVPVQLNVEVRYQIY
jgi:TonB family protein